MIKSDVLRALSVYVRTKHSLLFKGTLNKNVLDGNLELDIKFATKTISSDGLYL